MRFSRMKRFRKNKKIIIASEILIIWYCIVVALTVLTSNTLAYFSDGSDVKSYISTAADWWDKSELHFPENGTQVMHTCPSKKISVQIKNIGLSMTKPTEYEIYYSEKKGNPEKYGKKISEGLINPIEAGQTSNLTYETELEGWFIFRALQRPGFNNNYESRSEIWSEKIKVQCIENKEKGSEEDKKEEIEEVEKEVDNDLEENEQGEVEEKVVSDSEESEQEVEEGKDSENEEQEKVDYNIENNENGLNEEGKSNEEDIKVDGEDKSRKVEDGLDEKSVEETIDDTTKMIKVNNSKDNLVMDGELSWKR